MKIRILSLILLLAFISYGQNSNKVKSVLNDAKQKYAPDKRTAIFDVEYSEKDGVIMLTGETNIPEAKDFVTKRLGEKFEMEDNIDVLPEEELKEKIYGIINLSVANLRSHPKHSAELATQSLLGTPVKVYKKKGWWFRIQTPDQYLAWVDDDGVYLVNEENYHAWIKAPKIIVTSDFTHSYKGASDESGRVSDIVAGNLLKFISEEGSYFKAAFPDGRTGYVKKEDAMKYNEWIESRNTDADKILEKAYSFLGTPYLWGGTSIKGMDCSGFTKTVYHLNGIVLRRDASQQVHTGELVSETIDFDKLQKGDLLFFGFKGTSEKKERITHVGIYIGDTEFIHASGLVKVNSLDSSRDNFSEYRYKSFIRAKRVLSSVNENGIETFLTNKFYTGEK
ncbi:MAG: cytochrome c [Melioribacteraceae bacterium]|nr:MAG: cytochrome c [Melioribacteraceae bacterium]